MLCILTIPTIGAHYCLADATVCSDEIDEIIDSPTHTHSLTFTLTSTYPGLFPAAKCDFAGSFGSLVIGLLIVDAALIEN